jgi:hypothetical protein
MSNIPAAQQVIAKPPLPITLDGTKLESFKCFTIHSCTTCNNAIVVPSFKIPSEYFDWNPELPAPDFVIAYIPSEKYTCPICGNVVAFLPWVKQASSPTDKIQKPKKSEESNDVS